MELFISDELLLNYGIVVAAGAICFALICFIILGIKGHSLKKRFDEEYGKR